MFITAVPLFGGSKQIRTIVDMAGRKLIVPAKITSVYPISPMGDIILYTLAPDKITGMTWNLDNEARSLLHPDYNSKPVLGGWFGKNTTGNPEVVIKAHPDIVLSVGNLDNTELSTAKRIEEQIGIPVVITDGKLNTIDSTYRFLGRLLGLEARAETLAVYCRSTLDKISKLTNSIPPSKKVRVYYAEGLNGLQTDPKGSSHTETLDWAGAINVADVPILSGYGRATVSFEQLLVWRPQLILVCLDRGYAHGTENYKMITSDHLWNSIDAVKKGNIYQIPSLPFNWIDRPPCVNRIIGLIWLTNLLYPDYYKIDIREETRKFYALFYHKKLSDIELNRILVNATLKK